MRMSTLHKYDGTAAATAATATFTTTRAGRNNRYGELLKCLMESSCSSRVCKYFVLPFSRTRALDTGTAGGSRVLRPSSHGLSVRVAHIDVAPFSSTRYPCRRGCRRRRRSSSVLLSDIRCRLRGRAAYYYLIIRMATAVSALEFVRESAQKFPPQH